MRLPPPDKLTPEGRRQSTGFGLFAVGATVLLSALDKLGLTWALVVVGILTVVAVLDELAAKRPLIGVGWVVTVGAGVFAYNQWGRWWGVAVTVIAMLLISPLANRNLVR